MHATNLAWVGGKPRCRAARCKRVASTVLGGIVGVNGICATCWQERVSAEFKSQWASARLNSNTELLAQLQTRLSHLLSE